MGICRSGTKFITHAHTCTRTQEQHSGRIRYKSHSQVSRDHQPRKLFSRCISYLFIGGWSQFTSSSSSSAILARASNAGEGNAYQCQRSVYIFFRSFFSPPHPSPSPPPRPRPPRHSAIPSDSPNRDRNRGTGGNSRETRRRRKHGIGVRAEVTPAPRRSRGRAPVRSDAFLSCSPLSGSTVSPLRHLFDSLFLRAR